MSLGWLDMPIPAKREARQRRTVKLRKQRQCNGLLEKSRLERLYEKTDNAQNTTVNLAFLLFEKPDPVQMQPSFNVDTHYDALLCRTMSPMKIACSCRRNPTEWLIDHRQLYKSC